MPARRFRKAKINAMQSLPKHRLGLFSTSDQALQWRKGLRLWRCKVAVP